METPLGQAAWTETYRSTAPISLSTSGVAPLSLAELAELANVRPLDVLNQSTEFVYGEVGGSQELRDMISTDIPGVIGDNVTVTSGAGEGLSLVAEITCNSDSHVIIQEPAHGSVAATARRRGCRFSVVSSPVTLQAIIDQIQPSTTAIFLTSPNNPTGQVLDETFLRSVATAAERVDALVVVDEVYQGIPLGKPVLPPAAATIANNAVTINSLSKIYSLPGLRVGWVAGPALLVDDVRMLQSMSSRSVPPSTEQIGLLALNNREKLLGRARALVYDAFAELSAMCEQSELIELDVPDGGSTAFPRLNVPDVDLWCAQEAEQHGILITPGKLCFGIPDRVRISLGLRPEARTKALAAFSKALAASSRQVFN